jgi:protein archease
MKPQWSHFDHGADIGVRGCGPDLDVAFAQVAMALTAIVTRPEKVLGHEAVAVSCQAPDVELLLVDWLNTVIFEMATRKCLFARYDVRINGLQLEATLWGEAVDVTRHAPAVEPKGATYTMLKVAQQNDGWCAECVVDV